MIIGFNEHMLMLRSIFGSGGSSGRPPPLSDAALKSAPPLTPEAFDAMFRGRE